MGLLDSLGVKGVGSIDFGSIAGGVLKFAIIFFLFVGVAGLFYGIYYVKAKKKIYNKKIHWFEEVNGEMIPVDDDVACELTIPTTNIQVFYIKKKDMYLPRPVIRMGKDSYWYCIKNNREIVNFRMKNMNKEMREANLEYDHTDMRYALTNLKELIKRNYRDKSKPWWREYKEIISLVLLIFTMTMCFIFITIYIGKLVSQIGTLIDHADQLIKSAEATRNSGVITQ